MISKFEKLPLSNIKIILAETEIFCEVRLPIYLVFSTNKGNTQVIVYLFLFCMVMIKNEVSVAWVIASGKGWWVATICSRSL